MQIIILSIHLLVSICLIGLVLLQRSEGGALGIGGGGGGSLMSGRGASDALARLTAIAGALFLGVSLGLTWLSGAGQAGERSIFDTPAPAQQEQPLFAPPAEPTVPQEDTAPAEDPTQSSLPSPTELAAAILPGPAPAAAAPAGADSTRAAPLDTRQANAEPAAAQSQGQPRQAVVTPASARQAPPQTEAARTTPQQLPPAVTGAVNGVTLTEPPRPESVEVGNGMEAVRRERAGPDF